MVDPITISVAFAVEAESQVYANPDAGTSIIDLYNTYGASSGICWRPSLNLTIDSNVLDF